MQQILVAVSGRLSARRVVSPLPELHSPSEQSGGFCIFTFHTAPLVRHTRSQARPRANKFKLLYRCKRERRENDSPYRPPIWFASVLKSCVQKWLQRLCLRCSKRCGAI